MARRDQFAEKVKQPWTPPLETVALPTADAVARPVKTEEQLAAEAHARTWAAILGNDKPRT